MKQNYLIQDKRQVEIKKVDCQPYLEKVSKQLDPVSFLLKLKGIDFDLAILKTGLFPEGLG